MVKRVEVGFIIIACILAILWFLNPNDNYEPLIVLLILLSSLVVGLSHRSAKKITADPSPDEIEKESSFRGLWKRYKQRFNKNRGKRAVLHPSESASFFAERFSQAFPGVRSTMWFEEKEAVKRLKVLLQEPLSFKSGNSINSPIWWWGDGNLQIERFRVLNSETVLLDTKELMVNRVAAVYSTSYKKLFVYVEAKAMPQTGLYEWSEDQIERCISDYGYAHEEYSIYKNKHFLTRAEHDDNATIINGKHVNLNGADELRERYITPYNFVIASHLSPINNNDFDEILCDDLRKILSDNSEISNLANKVKRLPAARVHWS